MCALCRCLSKSLKHRCCCPCHIYLYAKRYKLPRTFPTFATFKSTPTRPPKSKRSLFRCDGAPTPIDEVRAPLPLVTLVRKRSIRSTSRTAGLEQLWPSWRGIASRSLAGTFTSKEGRRTHVARRKPQVELRSCFSSPSMACELGLSSLSPSFAATFLLPVVVLLRVFRRQKRRASIQHLRVRAASYVKRQEALHASCSCVDRVRHETSRAHLPHEPECNLINPSN